MRAWQTLFWGITGIVLAAGFLTLPSIGVFILPAGLLLLIVGAFLTKGRNLWALLIGIGIPTAAIFIWRIATAPPSCSAQQAAVPFGTKALCGSVPSSYYVLAAIFGIVGILGIAWPFIQRRSSSTQ
ncbi:MAG TPA: hypothetical protein VFY89_02445 [Ktedonobacterales bacterium]